MINNTLVFIDAGFLSKLSKYLGDNKYLKLDLIKFSKNISKKENLFLNHIFYATAPPFQGTPPIESEKKRKVGYDKFKQKFQNRKDFTFLEGRIQKLKLDNGEIKYSQKGVDTILTMALSSVLLDFKKIKKIILVSSDTDFCPIIEKLKEWGVEVILYSYYEKNRNSNFSRSHHLIDSCSKYIKLNKEDLINSLIEKK